MDGSFGIYNFKLNLLLFQTQSINLGLEINLTLKHALPPHPSVISGIKKVVERKFHLL
jgi:hypothetical protein